LSLKTYTLAALALMIPGLAAGVSFEFINGTFEVTGITPGPEPAAGWQSVFPVYAGAPGVPPMLGTYQAFPDKLVFTPRFPVTLNNGLLFRATYKGSPLDWELQEAGPLPVSSTRVAEVYPTTDVLPSNELKFYVYFSAPMQRGGVWQHIRLLDDTGKKVDLAFLEIDQELWDPNNQRLTILFDPGRIKRGVKPQMDTGSAIVEGRHYTLVIDKELRDAHGVELVAPFRKEFRGEASIRTGVDLKDWKIRPPAAGSRDPLQIDFPRPLDYAILEHVIHVDTHGGEIPGVVSIDAHETRWRFIPSTPWRSGSHTLVIDMALEDLAGNRIGRPFDVDLLNHPADRITAATTSLPFEIR
jgi:hypothetical protein